jgi:predicted nucleic acid-binding protein
MFLLDTNVVSELLSPRPHGAVVAWLQSIEDSALRVSAVTLGEIQASVELTREHGAQKAAKVESWLDLVASTYQVLPMDAPAFRAWARLMRGRSDTPYEDAMIAATALVHGLTVVTRNVAGFASLQVPLFDPFTYQGDIRASL